MFHFSCVFVFLLLHLNKYGCTKPQPKSKPVHSKGAARNGEETYELQIRSFFESSRTGARAWDEPPSGAHQIRYASTEARNMAQIQMDDLQAATTEIPPSPSGSGSTSSLKGIRKLFKRRNKSKSTIQPPKGLTYKSGSTTQEVLDGVISHSTQWDGGDCDDSDLQKTIIVSLGEASENEELYRLARLKLEEQEAIDMAKAYSLSEEYYKSSYGNIYQGYGEHYISDQGLKVEAQPNVDRGIIINQDDYSLSDLGNRQV